MQPHTRIFASFALLEREYLDLVEDGSLYVEAYRLLLKEDGEFEFIELETNIPA